MKKEKGQIQLSFGVIFSIILIIAVVAVSGYIIVKVLNTGNSIDCNLYYQALQQKINEAWGSNGEVSYVFNYGLGAKTEKVCFGNMNQSLLDADDKVAYQEIKDYTNAKNNMFFYPIKSCGDNGFAFTLKNVRTDGFFCVSKDSGKTQVKLVKSRFDSLVKLSE